MADTFNFTTGPASLPDIGVLSYNGCVFSPLFETKVSGQVIQDNAGRTTKFMEYTINVDGYVTLPDGATSTGPTMSNLRKLLTAQSGTLVYLGRGNDMVVNAADNNAFNPLGAAALSIRDVAWGPVPELLEFQPLGAGRSAKVQWVVKVRIPEIAADVNNTSLLQFTYDIAVSYGEDGFSTCQVHGTLEIPLNRARQNKRAVPRTVDDDRVIIEQRVMAGIDLSRFRVTNRAFNTSRDKRTLEWSYSLEEKPYMDLPQACTIARGNYSVRPARAGMGLCMWLCNLRATYTVRADHARRTAWVMFLWLMRTRMDWAPFGNITGIKDEQNQNPRLRFDPARAGRRGGIVGVGPAAAAAAKLGNIVLDNLGDDDKEPPPAPAALTTKPMLIDFNIEEGLYLDSKTTTFSATWRLVTTFSHIMLASGLWQKTTEKDDKGKNLWATSMQTPGPNIMGVQSWLRNDVDPTTDVIVDFGGG